MFPRDLLYALRVVRRQPALTFVAVISLAFGIGANAALLSVADGVGLRPLPIERPDRLVRIFTARPPDTHGDSSYPDFRDLGDRTPTLTQIAAYGSRGAALGNPDGSSEVAILAVVTGNYFQTLGVRPVLGRVLSVDETDTADPAVVISHRLWQRRYQGDSAILGRQVTLNGHPYVVAGVLPRDFTGLEPTLAPDVWVTTRSASVLLGSRNELESRSNRWLKIVGRLRDGVAIGEVSGQVRAVMSDLARTYPATNTGRDGYVTSEAAYRERLGRVAAVVLGAIGLCVLLLACANVAALLLARAEERRSEMALRAAIGASRARLVRQLLLESAVLAAFAACAGLALAWCLIRAVPTLIPPSPLPLGFSFRLDPRVTLFAVLLATATIAIFGLAPALRGSKADVGSLLKAGDPGGHGGRPRVRRTLVASQIAISLALLTVAALLVRSLWSLERVDPGFDRRPMLIVALSPSAIGYSDSAARAYYGQLVERVQALPGVERVSLARRAPLSQFGGGATEIVRVHGHEPPQGEPGFRIHFNVVGPGYFETMGTPLVWGRGFTTADGPGQMRAAVVSEAMARRFWPRGDAVGRRVSIGERGIACEIVGVARDGKYNWLTEKADPYIYFPLSQRFIGEATLLVRTAGNEREVIPSLRQALASIDKAVPALQIETMEGHLRVATFVERTMASLVLALGVLGLFLAVVGLYGLASYVAGRRGHEIGIRIAIGAGPADVVRNVFGDLAWPVAIGLVGGLVLAFMVARVAAGSIYAVNAADPRTYGASALAVVVVIVAATFLPVRRAVHTDPARALRTE